MQLSKRRIRLPGCRVAGGRPGTPSGRGLHGHQPVVIVKLAEPLSAALRDQQLLLQLDAFGRRRGTDIALDAYNHARLQPAGEWIGLAAFFVRNVGELTRESQTVA